MVNQCGNWIEVGSCSYRIIVNLIIRAGWLTLALWSLFPARCWHVEDAGNTNQQTIIVLANLGINKTESRTNRCWQVVVTASTRVYKFTSLAIYHESRRYLHETTRLILEVHWIRRIQCRTKCLNSLKILLMFYIWNCSFLSSNSYAAHSVARSYFIIVILFENFAFITTIFTFADETRVP